MKNQKFIKLILSKYTILGMQIVAMALFLFFVINLSILPRKTIALISGVLAVLWLFNLIVINSGRRKLKLRKRVVVVKLLSIITSITLLIGTTYVIRGNSFINNIANRTNETHIVSVRVLKDSNVKSLEDIKDSPIAVSYQNDSKNTVEAIAHFEQLVNRDLYLEQKDSYFDVAEALLNKEVKAIVIGNEHVDLLQERYEDFKNETVEIATYKIEREIATNDTVSDVTENTFTVYLTGIDTYGDVSEVARSDVNLLITVNPVSKQILMTSIPRDTKITLPSYKSMDKLAHAGVYGVNETMASIEDLLGIDVHYYAKTNFTGIEAIIDQLGGITIDSPHEDFVTLHGNYLITKGINEMDGDKALSFVRERYNLLHGDFDRGRNQQLLLESMLEKAMSPAIITNFNRLLSAIEGTFETNLSDHEIRSLINMQLNDMSDWEMFNAQVTGSGYRSTSTYSMWGQESYVIEPDTDRIKSIEELIIKMQDGQSIKPSEVEGLMERGR
jgi:LCP family protein required for cell wall assembly